MSKSRGPNKSAAKRRENAAHSASRGLAREETPAPKGRKKLPLTSPELRLIPIPFADEIRPGDSLADKLLEALRRAASACKLATFCREAQNRFQS
jgi:hypothetical protein